MPDGEILMQMGMKGVKDFPFFVSFLATSALCRGKFCMVMSSSNGIDSGKDHSRGRVLCVSLYTGEYPPPVKPRSHVLFEWTEYASVRSKSHQSGSEILRIKG